MGAADWAAGDRVVVDGRVAVVKRDMRAQGHNRATLVWEDTGEEQKRVDASTIQKLDAQAAEPQPQHKQRKRQRNSSPTPSALTADDGAKWLQDEEEVRKFVKRFDIERLLDESGGLVVLQDFLPEHVAAAVLRALNNLPTAAWESATGEQDADYDDSIEHAFNMAEMIEDDEGTLLELGRLMWLLAPQYLPNFTAAK